MLLQMARRTGDDPTLGGNHDPGVVPARHVGLGNRPTERPRPQNRAQVHPSGLEAPELLVVRDQLLPG
jgi:hypothetical protein